MTGITLTLTIALIASLLIGGAAYKFYFRVKDNPTDKKTSLKQSSLIALVVFIIVVLMGVFGA